MTDEPSSRNLSQSFSQWAVHTGGKFSPTIPTISNIPAGFYEIGSDPQIGVYLEKKEVTTDDLYELPSAELTDMIDDIHKFWDRADEYAKYGFLHKRGILLYGDPGAGKSGIIQLCSKHLIETKGGVVINLTDVDQVENYSKFANTFRKVEGNRPLIVILEDIDAIADDSWSASMLLNLLDGVKQIPNVVYIATTNYPEKLAERITNRPSRFDRRYEIEMPSAEVREAYIRKKLTTEDLKKIDIKRWIKESDGFSLAHMRELIISVVAMDNTFEDTIARLNGMKVKPKIKKRGGKLGFGND